VLTLRSARRHKEIWLLGFEEIPDRTGAESLRGTRLLAPEEDEAPDEGDGWYEEDLAGLEARDPEGTVLGAVVGLDLGVGQDRLVIELTDGVRTLVPFVEAIVPTVDVEGGHVVVDAPAGLLDLGREDA
jgi:16S rRNA processing protein RimM